MSHTPTADGRSSPIDEGVLEELRGYDESGEILDELIDVFLQDTPQRLDALQAAVAASDAAATRHEAHALKSSCAQLGALHLSALCRRLEELGRNGTLEGATALADEALGEFPRVEQALLAARSR